MLTGNHAHGLPQYPEQWTSAEIAQPRVVVVQCFSLLCSLLILILGAIKLRSNLSRFFMAVALAGVPFFISDIAYLCVLGQALSINANEIFRTVVNFMSLWLISTLSATRFKAFQIAKTISWYSERRSRFVIGFLYTQGLFTIVGLMWTYGSEAHLPYFPPNPLRKMLLLQQVATSVLVNFLFDCISFKTVWVIRRKALEYARQRQKKRLVSQSSSASLWKHRATTIHGKPTSFVPAAAGLQATGASSRSELNLSAHAVAAASNGSMPTVNSGLGQSGSVLYSDLDEGYFLQSSPVIMSPGAMIATGTASISGHLPLSPTTPNSRTSMAIGKTREQGRLDRFQRTTLIVLAMLVFLALTSCIGFAVWMTTCDFFGDALSALCARIYVLAAVCHWTQITHIVK